MLGIEVRSARAAWPLLAFIFAFASFAAIAPDSFINGDAVVYAEQIRHANFAERTTHLGYYLIAYPVSFLPFLLSHSLNLLNCAFGAGVVVFAGLIGQEVSGSKIVGPLSALVVAANCFLVGNSVNAEVYIPQTFFLLLAMYLWRRDWTFAAGLGFGIAFLITASSALAAPFFVVMRPKWRPLVALGAVAGVVAVGALLPVLDNYLYGARGLMGATGLGVDYKLATLKTGRDLFFGFFALMPFLIAGAIECSRRPDLRRFGLAVAAMWVAIFVFGERYMDVPVQLTTYALGGIIVAIGIEATLFGSHRLAIAGAVVGFCLIGVILLLLPFVPSIYADHLPTTLQLGLYAAAALLTAGVLIWSSSPRGVFAVVAVAVACNVTVIAATEIEVRKKLADEKVLAAQVLKTPDAVIVAKWNDMVRMNWLVHGSAYHASSFDVDAISGRYPQPEALEKFTRTLKNRTRVIMVGSDPGLEPILVEMGYNQAADIMLRITHASLWLRNGQRSG